MPESGRIKNLLHALWRDLNLPTRRSRRKHTMFILGGLAFFVRHNLPIVPGLGALASDCPRDAEPILQGISAEVSAGVPLADGLSHYLRLSAPDIETVRMSEQNGTLADGLKKVVDERTRSERLKKMTIMAMVYPLAVCVIAGTILYGLLVFIIPKFKAMFDEMDITLPALTQGLISISRWLSETWYLIPFAVVLIILLYRGLRVLRRVPGLGLVEDAAALYVPFLGRLRRLRIFGDVAGQLAILLGAGVPAVRALHSLAQAQDNLLVARRLRRMRDAVAEGSPLSDAFRRPGRFPRSFCWMAACGEDSTELPSALEALRDQYGRRLEWWARVMVDTAGPLAILCIAAVQGLVVMALFSPLVALTYTVGAP